MHRAGHSITALGLLAVWTGQAHGQDAGSTAGDACTAPHNAGTQTAGPRTMAEPLRKMIEAALASGNAGDIATVARYIKQASPEDAAQIDCMVGENTKAVAAARVEKLRRQPWLRGWKGEGQIGGTQSSGNTDTVSLTVGLKLSKEGWRWTHKLSALVDYDKTDGATDKNQMQLGVESDYRLNQRLFVYGSAQVLRDRFAGFTSQVSLSGGAGFKLVRTPRLTLDLKAGPAWRRTDYIDQPTADTLTVLTALSGSWKIAPYLTFSEDASALSGDRNVNVTTLSALSFQVSKKLSTRVSYQILYNTNPPTDYKPLDRLTRFTLVYGF